MLSAKIARKLTRQAYKIRGFARLAEMTRKAYSSCDNEFIINDYHGDLKFVCTLNDHITSHIFWRGAYSYDQLKLLSTILKRDMTFFDIGANCGEFTIFAAKHLDQGMIYAFEPVKSHVQRLYKNIDLNKFKNIEIIQTGLSDHEGEAKIYTQETAFGDGTIHKGLDTLFPHAGRTDYVDTVPLISLDDFVAERNIEAIHIIKIDIEGSELPMLRGAKKTLEKHKPIIFLELNRQTCQAAGYEPEDILSYLAQFGYECYTINCDSSIEPLKRDAIQDFQNVFCQPTKLS